MAPLTQAERTLIERLGAYTMLSRHDPHEVTAPLARRSY